MADSKQTRRAALRVIGATAAAAGLTTGATAQDNEPETEDDHGGSGDETDRQPIILAGRTEYWYGIAPGEVEGEENPTLNLEDGRTYDLVWINVDGAEHELILETEAGEELEESESSETAGEAVSMTFEASEDAAEYYCEYHPESMRGDVAFEGSEDGGGNETARESGNETDGEGMAMGC